MLHIFGVCSVQGWDARTYVVLGIANEPGPSRTEVVGGLLSELGLESGKRAEGLVDELQKLSRRLASALRGQRVPVEGMVPDL